MKEVSRKIHEEASQGTFALSGGFCISRSLRKSLIRLKQSGAYIKAQPCKLPSIFILLLYLLPLFVALNFVFGKTTFCNLQAAELPSVDTSCCKCHTQICEDDLNKTYVHQPFLQQQCPICHVRDGTVIKQQANTSSPENITWLEEHFSLATTHWFTVPVESLNSDKLIVCARDNLGNSITETLFMPPIASIPMMTDDHTPPVVTSAGVNGVFQGVLISAYIGWTTDEESDSEIRYGIEGLHYSVKEDKFTTDHKIVLYALQPDTIYQFTVISRDIFGNKTESDLAYFSTEELSEKPQIDSEEYAENVILWDVQYYQNGSSYLVNFQVNKPVTLLIGSETEGDETETSATDYNLNVPPDHPFMNSGNDLLISTCTKCHTGFAANGKHPVNVYPNKQVNNPRDYLTSPDVCVTCVTCHFAHASDNDYILRFCYRGGVMKAGYFADIHAAQAAGGCLVCHASKGVLPQNR